jgi:type IV secretion system protein VirB1
LSACAPNVDVRTAAAIVAVESGGDPLSLHDNTSHSSFHPRDLAAATRLAQSLIGRGDSVDLGLAQVNSGNFAAFGVTAAQMLEPCRNLSVSQRILARDYAAQYQRATGPTEGERRQLALRLAFSTYNSGSAQAAPSYADLVVAATSSVLVRETTAIADAHRAASPNADVFPATAAAKPSAPARIAYVPPRASAAFAGMPERTIVGAAFVGGSR